MKTKIKAAVLIRQDNKFLFVQESCNPSHGLWNWVQGSLEENEKTEMAAIREAKEETNIDIQIIKKLAVLTETLADTKEIHVFLAEPLTYDIQFPASEIMAVEWLTRQEIIKRKDVLMGTWIIEILSAIGQ